jgi:dTDP-4-dehydrorhamnose reductase
MAEVLLVGANGQVGWEIRRQASAAGIPYCALTRAQLDITNRDAVLGAIENLAPSIVINAAAYTAVDRAEDDAEAAYAVNRDGAKFLAEACFDADASLIHISTDYVFDGSKRSPYKEDDIALPLGVYGASKLAGEEAVREHCSQHVILRTSWVYGVHGQNFVRTMLRLGCERQSLKVVDDQYGSPTFAGDLGTAILRLVANLRCGTWPEKGYGIFHCAGQGVTTWCGFARAIFERSSVQPVVEAIATVDYPTPARRPINSVLECGKLRNVHGIIMRPWQTALEDMLGALSEQTEKSKEKASL